MSLKIRSVDLLDKIDIPSRDIDVTPAHIQSVNIYQTDGSFITTEPFANRLVWYPQGPFNASNTALGGWKIFESFTGYGFLSLPMDARFDYTRRILWIADSGNRRVLKVNVDTGAVLDEIQNGYLASSLVVNINDGSIYVRSIVDTTSQIIQHYNSKAEFVRDFVFDGEYEQNIDDLEYSCEFSLKFPLPSSMCYDHNRNRLWWVSGCYVYMVDVNNKNIVHYDMGSDGFCEGRSVEIDFESGNAFVVANRVQYNNWYVLQMFKDNNKIVSIAYVKKLEPSSGECAIVTTTTTTTLPIQPTLCSLDLNTAGGDEGYDHTWNVTKETAGKGFNVDIDNFATVYVPDQLLIYVDGAIAYDSGCISTLGSPVSGVQVPIPKNTKAIRIRVIPECEGAHGTTAWALRISCSY